MCGIVGFIDFGNSDIQNRLDIASSMAGSLKHRGPDSGGVWQDTRSGLVLAHRRLAIRELSELGHQPMLSSQERYVIVYNGEIYNVKELKALLSSRRRSGLKGTSDTEVLLECFEEIGVRETIERAVGMFAIAAYDTVERKLFLIRDRFGEKPVFYGFQQSVFMFSSECSALKKHPAFQKSVDRESLALYFRFGYVPAPWCIWEGIKKLVPGHILTISVGDNSTGISVEPYWSLRHVLFSRRRYSESEIDFKSAVDQTEDLILSAISGQLVSDVPVGAFLSGGVDSSLVAAMASRASGNTIRTFSVGFDDPDYDESRYAESVARTLKTNHVSVTVKSSDAASMLLGISGIYDEPFGDASALATKLVSKIAREFVTVALSGDGGDEVFGGYGRYPRSKVDSALSLIARLPRAARSLLRNQVSKFCIIDGDRFSRISNMLVSESSRQIYRNLMSHWTVPPVIGSAINNYFDDNLWDVEGLALEERRMAVDTVTYLPDDILVKVDRAAMSVSLETRVPFLDHRLVEYAWTLPLSYLISRGKGKIVLRKVLEKHVPPALIDRPKKGFGVPVDKWIRGQLRPAMEDSFAETRIKNAGYVCHRSIQDRLKAHLDGKANFRDSLWIAFMWERWLDENFA